MAFDARNAPAPYQPYAYSRRTAPDRPLVGLGVAAIAAAAVGFCVWFFLAIGIGMCTDGHPAATCHHVNTAWGLTGACVAATLVAGLVTAVAARRRRHAPAVRRTLAITTTASLVLLVVTVVHLWNVASGV